MPLPLLGFAFLTSTAFTQFLKFLVFSIAIQFLVGLGIAFIVFTGLDLALSSYQEEIMDQLSSLHSAAPDAYGMLIKAGFLDALNIIFATIASIIAIKTVQGSLRVITLGGGV